MTRPSAEEKRHSVQHFQSPHGRTAVPPRGNSSTTTVVLEYYRGSTGNTAVGVIPHKPRAPFSRPVSHLLRYGHRALVQERRSMSQPFPSADAPSLNNYSPKLPLCMNYRVKRKKVAQKVWRVERNAYLCRRITQKQDREYAKLSTLLVVVWFDDSIVAKHDAFMCHTERNRKRLVDSDGPLFCI